MPPQNPFYVFIETATANRIISGYPDGTFRPASPIRRDEMAQVVYAAQQHQPTSPSPTNTPALGLTDTPTSTATPFFTPTPGALASTFTPQGRLTPRANRPWLHPLSWRTSGSARNPAQATRHPLAVRASIIPKAAGKGQMPPLPDAACRNSVFLDI